MGKIAEGWTEDGVLFEMYESAGKYGLRLTNRREGWMEYWNLVGVRDRVEASYVAALLRGQGSPVVRGEVKRIDGVKMIKPKVEAKRVMQRSIKKEVWGEPVAVPVEVERPAVPERRPAVEFRVPRVRMGLGRRERERLLDRFKAVLTSMGEPLTGEKYRERLAVLRDKMNMWEDMFRDVPSEEAYVEAEKEMLEWMETFLF